MASRVLDESNLEFEGHLKRYPADGQVQLEDVEDNQATSLLMRGDYDFLKALTSEGKEKSKYIAAATEEYLTSSQLFEMILLKFYMDDSVAAKVFPIDPKTGLQYRRANIELADPSKFANIFDAAMAETQRLEAAGTPDHYSNDRREFVLHIGRATGRLSALGFFRPTTQK